MKGNSIEEDIKNIEEIIELSKEEIDAKDENITAILDIEDLISLEHILSDYKRVLKENEELKKSKITYEKFRDIQEKNKNIVDNNYISKKKIEDTIEELKGKLEDISRRREKSKTKEEETVLWCLEIRTDERIKTLQELL